MRPPSDISSRATRTRGAAGSSARLRRRRGRSTTSELRARARARRQEQAWTTSFRRAARRGGAVAVYRGCAMVSRGWARQVAGISWPRRARNAAAKGGGRRRPFAAAKSPASPREREGSRRLLLVGNRPPTCSSSTQNMSASTEPLASAAPTTESIYTGIVPVVLKHADREDRADLPARSQTAWRSRGDQTLPRTDESDCVPAVHARHLGGRVPRAQGRAVDPRRLPDLPAQPRRKRCAARRAEASEENPRFVATLSTLGGAPVFGAHRDQHLPPGTHLSRFVAGNDGAIKADLAGRVADFERHRRPPRGALRTRQLQETAALAAQQAERLRAADEEHARRLRGPRAGAVAVAGEGAGWRRSGAAARRRRRARPAGREGGGGLLRVPGAARVAERRRHLTASSHAAQLRLSDREAKPGGGGTGGGAARRRTAELREFERLPGDEAPAEPPPSPPAASSAPHTPSRSLTAHPHVPRPRTSAHPVRRALATHAQVELGAHPVGHRRRPRLTAPGPPRGGERREAEGF